MKKDKTQKIKDMHQEAMELHEPQINFDQEQYEDKWGDIQEIANELNII